ncbi:MAG: hypothetical protein HY699_19960 [Deltaproteobacteria bacterium]|nr:hypothetical protein [Deltaproteobacteria bacterium]
MRETANEAMMARVVDNRGRIIGFSILMTSRADMTRPTCACEQIRYAA